MLEPKTHFEQVPLEIVQEIVAKQTEPETAIELGRATKKQTSQERPLNAEGRRWRAQR